MVIFLANASDLSIRRLHSQIKRRFQTDPLFEQGWQEVASQRDPGPYRVVAETDPHTFLNEPAYPVTSAQIDVGFQRQKQPHQGPDWFYWISWIESDRDFILAWHQDADHASYGPVHLQVSQSDGPTHRQPAQFIQGDPRGIVEQRLTQLPEALDAVEWQHNGRRLLGLTDPR